MGNVLRGSGGFSFSSVSGQFFTCVLSAARKGRPTPWPAQVHRLSKFTELQGLAIRSLQCGGHRRAASTCGTADTV
jgi:hypothetical protein